MSTILFSRITKLRDKAPEGKSLTTAPPGMPTYVDAMAALVPAEVLSLHAIILSFTTKTETIDGKSVVTIIDAGILSGVFYGLILLSIFLYVIPKSGDWRNLDVIRALIPPIAFITWTMLQKATAFDAVCPGFSSAKRTVIALFVAVVLGVISTYLAKKSDQSSPSI